MRRGKVYYKDIPAGMITETDDGEFVFRYEEQYVKNILPILSRLQCLLVMSHILTIGCSHF